MALNFYQYTKSADKYGPIAAPEPVKASEPGLLSNMGRSAASGALSGVGGIFDFVGADGIAKQFYGWSDDARQSMSAEAQADMAKPFFSENDQGEIQLGEGLTDLDTWLLTMANVAGQFAPTAIPGAGLANAATKALQLGANGAKVATAVGMGAVGGAGATGQGMEQARQEWKQMPDELKLQSDLFKNTIREMKQQRPELDGDALWTAAEDNVAERLASEVQTDPKVLLANFAGSAIADPIIGRALTGARLAKSGAFRSAAKGFAIEGGTEAGQASVQEYGINQALSQVDGRDPMDGVAIAALNEGVAGGMLGAAAGGVGGVLNRKQAEPVKDPDADAIRDSNPALAAAIDGVAQSSADRQADLDAVIGSMPAISQLPLEGELLGPEPAPSEPLMITDKNIIFAGDGRPQQAAQEFADSLQREAYQAASVPRLPQKDIIFAGDQSGVRVKGNGEVYKSPREAVTSKQARAMKRSGTPVEAVQFGDGWGWRVKEVPPEQQAEQVQQPEAQAVPAVQLAPVQKKKGGDPFKTEKEMKISASYKAAVATGAELETVPVDGGFGFRVKSSEQAAMKQSPEADTAPQAAQDAQARPAIEGRPTGKQAVATTPAGRDIDVEYQVVEADSLVTSNLEDGRSNPDFPAELQPRDRSRAASQDQINRIAGAVNPRLLAESATTSDGAPIISADGIVESGNGRSLGLRKAYRQGGAEGYRQFLTDSGFDIEGMKQPVLVRVRRTELSPEDRLAYIKESNQRTTLEMSATEQAASDAAKMAGVVADYQGGEITSAENRSFVRKFMQNVAGEAERGGLMDSSGVLSQNGRRRIEAALLSAAYGDDGIVAEVFESGDTDIKAIGGALLDAAGKWAQMRNAERDGMIADGMDVTPFLLEAVNLIRRARGEGKALIELVSTDDIFSGTLPDATRAWLSIFYRGDTLSRARGRDKVAQALSDYADEALKTQPGDGLFGDVVTSDQVMGAVNERIKNQEGGSAQQGGLFTAGNADATESRAQGGQERQGSSAERTNGPDREQPEKPAVAAEPTTQTPADAGVSVSGPVERIDDFGEKLGGARKDVWGGFSEAVSSELDTRELPLSKSFPEPDYVKMAADGIPMETLAIIAAMRSEIPAKPRVSYKVRRWAEKVDVLRNFARDLIGGELTPEQVITAMSKSGGELQAIADAIPAIAQANPETIKLAAKYRLGSGSFSIFRGKQYSPSKTFYYPQNGRSEILDLASPDKQGAIDNLVKLIKAESAANPDTAGQKQSKISIYSDRYTKQIYLGWEGGSGVLRIQDFATVAEARDYLKTNRDEVETKLKKLKQVPEMRRPENRDRVGPPRFAGTVTPAIFADTFGFRGVEFGNWVEQSKRQKDLNEAYDALMDLADVLGVPPKALALNGELGMAFGARGKGAAASVKAAAHYEPSYVAINLTKESGAGSLAHEWWHAVDNYFSRLTGKPNNFVTEGGHIRGGDMRQEVRDAFTSLIHAIRKTKVMQRASSLDSRRSKVYWSTEIEASARSFETFIISELEAKGFSNDYLANVIDPEAWDAIESAEQTYPYPTKSEQEIINPAFRSFFDTLQTKETDKGVMLFSKQNTIKAKPNKGVNSRLAKQFVNGIMQRLNGAAGIKVVVLETQAEAEKLWQMSLSGDLVRGAYNRATNTAYVIAENIKSMDELREVVAHEVIGHGGLQNVISKADYKTFIERLKQTRNNRAFAEQWSQIDNDYEGFSENDKAEELFAYFVQNKPATGPVKLWFNALKRWLHKALVSVGLAKAGDPDIEAMQDMLESIRAGFMFNRVGEADSAGSDLAFSKSRTTEQADALDKLGLGEEAAETVAEQAKRRANETVDTLKSSSFWKRLNEGIFDGLAGIKQAEEAAGITDPNKQGYVSARLASGLSDILHGVFHYGAPEWRDGVVQRKADTKGLLEVFGMLGDDLNDWLAWMGANRAERLMAEGRENNLSQADIDELKALADGKEALFEQVRQEYNKINSAIIDLAEGAGLLSAEQRGGFDEEWYVPFFRNMEEEVDPEMSGIAAMVHGPRSRKGLAGQSAQIKELKGGRQSTKDLLENIIHRQSTMIDASIKNKAMAEVVSNLEGTPFMQAVDSPDIAALSQTELNLLQKVKVMRNGKAEAYTVTDPALLRGLLQIHTIGNNSLFNRMARSAKRFLTAGITLSPDFIIKNFVRDAAHAWMINKDGFRFGADSVKGLRQAFAEDEAYRDLIFTGAAFQGGYVHGADPEAAAQQIRRALRSKGLGEADIQSYMDSLITKGGELLEAYRTASDKVENANRLSTYEAALAAGKSRRQSAYEAKDLMDYSLKGNFAMIGTMIDMLPFFNARLQGMSKLVRAMKAGDGDRVLKVLSANLAMKGLKVAAFSLALAAMNDDDERYQELPDWDKDANWHFFIGDQHFRIPKPFELGILFGTMPERMFHYAAGSQPGSDLGKAAAHAVWNTLALNPIPQLALPVVEVMTNKSFFKGSQIEGMGDAQRQPEDRYNAYTSETAKQIGAAFGVSPKMVEHLILGYTGTLGGYVLGMSDIAARQMLGIEAADTPISRYPVIKAFYQGDAPKTATKFQDEFYDALQSAGEAYGSYKRAVEEGDVVRQQDLKESESQALGARVQLNRIQRKLSELNKQAELVNNNQNLSGAEKRQKLDDIAKRKNALYQNAYVRYQLGEW